MLEYSDFLRVLASLSIVIIILYSIYYFLTRYFRGNLPGQKGLIQILDIKYIGKNKGLMLVKANNRFFFLYFDEKNVSIIEKWDTLNGEEEKKDEKIHYSPPDS